MESTLCLGLHSLLILIQSLWSVMKHRVEMIDPKNKPDVIKAVIKVWADITPELLESLIGSMKSRKDLCVAAKGGKIRY